MLKGLWESVSGEWAGDVDLNDGKLQQAYEQHQDRIKWLKSIGLQNQGNRTYQARFNESPRHDLNRNWLRLNWYRYIYYIVHRSILLKLFSFVFTCTCRATKS